MNDLIQHLARLPGIGDRTATRLAFYLLRANPQYRAGFVEAIQKLSEVKFCSTCATVTSQNQDPCAICTSPVRNPKALCVVEKPSDIFTIEKLNVFQGRYFVLHGLLSPMEGIGPHDIRIPQLVQKIRQDLDLQEVILALSPTVEGDATAQFVTKQLEASPITISRLASGLAVGTDLEFADQISLGKAFEARLVLR